MMFFKKEKTIKVGDEIIDLTNGISNGELMLLKFGLVLTIEHKETEMKNDSGEIKIITVAILKDKKTGFEMRDLCYLYDYRYIDDNLLYNLLKAKREKMDRLITLKGDLKELENNAEFLKKRAKE